MMVHWPPAVFVLLMALQSIRLKTVLSDALQVLAIR